MAWGKWRRVGLQIELNVRFCYLAAMSSSSEHMTDPLVLTVEVSEVERALLVAASEREHVSVSDLVRRMVVEGARSTGALSESSTHMKVAQRPPAGTTNADGSQSWLSDLVKDVSDQVPAAEWAKMPQRSSDGLDRKIYHR